MQSSSCSSQLIETSNPERSVAGFDADDIAKLTDFFSILISIDRRSKEVTNEKDKREVSSQVKGVAGN